VGELACDVEREEAWIGARGCGGGVQATRKVLEAAGVRKIGGCRM